MSDEKNVTVPLEDWVRKIIAETVATHAGFCPVRVIVEGEPSDRSKGLSIRVDRLERTLVLSAWLIAPVYLAGVGLIIEHIFKIITQ